MKRWWLIIMVLVVSLILWRYVQYSTEKASLPPRSELIQNELDRRLFTYTKNMRERCREKILEDAKVIADSIAFARADALMLFDTLSRPPKPTKPGKPAILPLPDSSVISPILPKEQ